MYRKWYLAIFLIPVVGAGIVGYFLSSFQSIEESLLSDQQEMSRHTMKLQADLVGVESSLERYIEQASHENLQRLQYQFDLVMLRKSVLNSVAAQLTEDDQARLADLNALMDQFDQYLRDIEQSDRSTFQAMEILIAEITRQQQLLTAHYDQIMQAGVSGAARAVNSQSYRIVIVFGLLIGALVAIALQLLAQWRRKQQLAQLVKEVDAANVRLESEVRERRRAEEALRHMARHDSLTGLYNRAVFVELTEQAIQRCRRNHTHCAVLFLDLDGFKEINDQYGHVAGDQALMEVSRRFRHSIREIDSVARLGGDEFTILLPDLEDKKVVTLIAERIIQAVTRPVVYEVSSLHLSVSIGVAFCPEQGTDAFELVRLADIAMYEAKNSGKNRCLFSEISNVNASN